MKKLLKSNKVVIMIILIIAIIIGVSLTILTNSLVNTDNSIQVYSDYKPLKIAYQEDKNKEKTEVLIVFLEPSSVVEETVREEEQMSEQQNNNNIEVSNNNASDNNVEQATQNIYKLEINVEQNVINVYKVYYDQGIMECIKVMLCSTGSDTPTSRTYKLKKYEGWEWKGLFGNVYGQYATQVTGNILIHSVPYTEKYNNASLKYVEYDKLGTKASRGCIRLSVGDAKWIYDNCQVGTEILFYSDVTPGPLGKPEGRKISADEEVRNWDPTDENPSNPWYEYDAQII